MQNEHVNLKASGAAWISQAAGREAGFNLEGFFIRPGSRLRFSRARGPNERAQAMPSNRRRIGRFLIDTAAIRNGCKLMKTNDGCTV